MAGVEDVAVPFDDGVYFGTEVLTDVIVAVMFGFCSIIALVNSSSYSDFFIQSLRLKLNRSDWYVDPQVDH